MRVLHVIGSVGVGGAEKHVLDLCLQQQALGLNVHVALPAIGALSTALTQHHIAYTIIRAGGRWHPWVLWSLRRVINDTQPDIIHAHMLKSAVMVGYVNYRIPCVTTAHNIVKHIAPFSHSQHVICVSEMVRVSLCQLGFPSTKCSVIHNAVETHAFSTVKREAMRYQMGWQDKLIVSCVARLVPAKGQVYAIQALSELVQILPNIKLVLIGDGGDHAQLIQLANELKLNAHIEMLGARADVADLLAATDVYLQPSIKEGFCIAFLEAMATGLACIGTATGAIPSMLSNNSGILIAPAQVPEIVDAILRLAQDQALRNQYAQAAKLTASTKFSPEKQAKDTLAVYQHLVG